MSNKIAELNRTAELEEIQVAVALGLVTLECQPRTKARDIIAFTTLLARHRILLAWKSLISPSQSGWLKEIMFFFSLEKMGI